MSQKRITPYKAVFANHGVLVEEQAFTARGHLRFLVAKDGEKRIFIAPGSPSDARGLANFRGDVRRWVREVASAPQSRAS